MIMDAIKSGIFIIVFVIAAVFIMIVANEIQSYYQMFLIIMFVIAGLIGIISLLMHKPTDKITPKPIKESFISPINNRTLELEKNIEQYSVEEEQYCSLGYYRWRMLSGEKIHEEITLSNCLPAEKQMFTITEAYLELTTKNDGFIDRTPYLYVEMRNDIVEIGSCFELVGYKCVSDFEGGIAPKGYRFESDEKYLVDIRTGKRVRDHNRTTELRKVVDNFAFNAGYKSSVDYKDLDPLTDALVCSEIYIRLRETPEGEFEPYHFMPSDDVKDRKSPLLLGSQKPDIEEPVQQIEIKLPLEAIVKNNKKPFSLIKAIKDGIVTIVLLVCLVVLIGGLIMFLLFALSHPFRR